jgi:hypothetical protein
LLGEDHGRGHGERRKCNGRRQAGNPPFVYYLAITVVLADVELPHSDIPMQIVAVPFIGAASTGDNDTDWKTRNSFRRFFEENVRLSQQHNPTDEADGADLQRFFQMRQNFVRAIEMEYPGHPA